MILALLAVAALPVNRPVAATERAFAAAAQREGQWAAFRRFMGPGAIMLAPGVVKAADFLAGRAEAPAAVQWAPERTITACDGSLAYSSGPWVSPTGKQSGRFHTIWRKQADGTWRWIYDGGTVGGPVGPFPKAVTAISASCAPATVATGNDGTEGGGYSKDESLHWRLDPGTDGKGHLLSVDYADGMSKRRTVILIPIE